MLEEILDRRNIEKALKEVEQNRGAAGIDGMDWRELRPYIERHWQELRSSLLEGSYDPQAVRKVEIPKPQGGKRVLGIPTVVDRLLGQAIAQWLTHRYERGFSPRSYGYRPGRSAHQAVGQALEYLKGGRIWVVEMDLSNFFDRISHDRLMSRLSKEVTDPRVLKLIRKYLRSGIMEGGVISVRQQGSPQGSPLSPILSNIVLDELDKELERRGHAFVRYADDISIYVRSEASAERVKTSISGYVEGRLRLKVNQAKTKVSRPEASMLLGFSFRKYKGEWIIKVARQSVERVKRKVKEITRRNYPLPQAERISRLNQVIKGWVNYFSIAKAQALTQHLDGNVRTRLRMCKWKQWKNPRTRKANLIKLGLDKHAARKFSRSYKGYCRVAQSYILCTAMTTRYFSREGYVGFYDQYHLRTQKQIPLF